MAGEPNLRASLSQAAYEQCLNLSISYININGSIRNREIREIAGINYDQAIHFFNRAISENFLERTGKASGTHFVKRASQ